MTTATEIPNRHWRKPRARTPRPTLCIGTTADPGREMHPRKPEVFGLEWLPVPPRKPITTPETALAAAAIECAVVEYLGILAVRLGVRRLLPNGLSTKGADDAADAFASAERFIFGTGCLYDFDVACACVGADPDSVRSAVRAAALRLGRDSAPLGSRKRGRTPKVASLDGRAQEARTEPVEVLA